MTSHKAYFKFFLSQVFFPSFSYIISFKKTWKVCVYLYATFPDTIPSAHPDIAFATISHLIIPFPIFHILLQKYLCYVIKISLISFFSLSLAFHIINSFTSSDIQSSEHVHQTPSNTSYPEQLMSMPDASSLRVDVRWHIVSGVILWRKYMSLSTSFLSNKTYSY